MRELLRAVHERKKIIPLLEPDEKRGGLTPMQVYQELAKVHRADKYAAWGLKSEVAEWGLASEIPRPEKLRSAIFGRGVREIEWNRIGFFQDVTMRLIGEALLSLDQHRATFVHDEVINKVRPLEPPSHRLGYEYHVYVSPHNQGAKALIEELNKTLGQEVQFTSQLDVLPMCALSPHSMRKTRVHRALCPQRLACHVNI